MRAAYIGICCVVLSIAAPHLVSAQQSIAPADVRQYIDSERGSSVGELVTVALERSPALRAARAQIDAARGAAMQANFRPNPSLKSDFRGQLGGPDRQTTIGVNWPLDLFRRQARVTAADEEVQLAEREVVDAERIFAATVRTKALRLLAAVRQLEIRRQVAANLTQFVDLVAARVASGAAPPLERDMAAVDARRAEADVLRQRSAADVALAELKAAVGLRSSEPLLLRERLEDLARTTASQATVAAASTDRVADARPDILAAEHQIKIASAMLDSIKREARSDVSLDIAYMRMTSGFPLFGFTPAGTPSPIHDVFHNVSVGATISLPWRDRRQGDIASAEARVEAARFEVEARRLAASAEIESARARVQQLQAALAIYVDTTRELANRNVEVIRQSYGLGRAALLDVLTETRRFLDTESAYTDLLIEILQARTDLAAAIGVIR
ncbi:MAG TPA: TolC family protein [Vicinamibacterales bacterium]|nr:TolC family protein [Vicinamibacterales bacterium]